VNATQNRSGGRKGHRYSYYVRVATNDDRTVFIDVTAKLGRPLDVKNVRGSCALEVRQDTIVFSTVNELKKVVGDGPLSFPSGVTHALHAQAEQHVNSLELGQLVIVYRDKSAVIPYSLEEDGTVYIEEQGPAIKLDGYRAQYDVFFRSPSNGRVIAVGFFGQVGRPGDPETLGRLAGLALRSLMSLAVFRTLSGFKRVEIPSRNQWAVVPYVPENVTSEIPVAFFDTNTTHIGTGTLKIEIDCANADPYTGALLYHFTPSDEVADIWATGDYTRVVHAAVDKHMNDALGGEAFIQDIVDAIALGELTDEQMNLLSDALNSFGPHMFQPEGWRAAGPGEIAA